MTKKQVRVTIHWEVDGPTSAIFDLCPDDWDGYTSGQIMECLQEDIETKFADECMPRMLHKDEVFGRIEDLLTLRSMEK